MSTMPRTNANPNGDPNGPLDVWLRFDSPDDEEASHEANTYRNEDGSYRVEWCHTAVGLVKTAKFSTYAAATAWLESHDYQDFTVIED